MDTLLFQQNGSAMKHILYDLVVKMSNLEKQPWSDHSGLVKVNRILLKEGLFFSDVIQRAMTICLWPWIQTFSAFQMYICCQFISGFTAGYCFTMEGRGNLLGEELGRGYLRENLGEVGWSFLGVTGGLQD